MVASDHNPSLAYLARTLRRARRDKELSQEALANRAGTHANHISAIERGQKDFRATTLMRLCDALELTPEELFAQYGREA